MAGLERIPAYIRTAKDEQVMEWALIENIQREDLDAIEIALAYQRLMDDYNLTQERMSERVGKKRATVANYLRLLKLPRLLRLNANSHSISGSSKRVCPFVKWKPLRRKIKWKAANRKTRRILMKLCNANSVRRQV